MTEEDLTKLAATPIKATGTVTLTAVAPEGDADGKPAKEGGNCRMTITAYNGGLMNVGWGSPVGIDLAGVSWRDDAALPILCLHDTHDIDAICGQAKSVKCDGGSIVVEAEFMPVTDAAKKIHALAKAGYKFQASVGLTATKTEFVERNETADLNGATVTGECIIVRAGTLNEVSIVPLGADGSTQTAIAAASQTNKEGKMPEVNKEVEAQKAAEAAKKVEAAQNAERERVAAVITACGSHADIMAQAVKDGWTAEKAELACLRAEKAEAKQKRVEASRPAAPAVIDLKAAAAGAADAKVVAAAACMGAAMPTADIEAQFKGVDLDAAADMRVTRLSDVFAAYGYDYKPGDDASMTKAIRAAFSTADIPAVLSNVAHKFILKGFGAVGEDWRKVSRAVPVTNFKAVKGVRLVMGGVLQSLGKGGELKHVSLSDQSRDLAAATKGSIIGITREDIINDDLGVLATIPERFGQMAGRTINKDVFGGLSTTGTDYGANTTGALNLENLAAAYAKAMEIKDPDGNPLGPLPTKILVSPGSYIAALNIYQSEQVRGMSAKAGVDNTLRGLLEPITTAFLSGTAYRIFNEQFPLVDIAFLNGRTTPVVETANADFSQLGIEMRCYFDYGVGPGDLKAALYSTGADD